jgi:pimeloyl-ACP methyl ester carboxylesterase
MVLGGWLGVAQEWEALYPAIDLDRFTFAFPDYRGYGASRLLAGEYTFAEAADDVAAIAQALQWERFALVGHSMGAMAMQRVYLRMPGRIERMVAVCGVPACGSRMPAERRAMFEQAAEDLRVRAGIFDASTGKRFPAAWSEGQARRTGALLLPRALKSYLSQWSGSGFEQELAAPALPVQLVVGENDPSLTPALMERTWMQWYPNTRLQVLAGCGHYPMLESPLALAATLAAFLSES